MSFNKGKLQKAIEKGDLRQVQTIIEKFPDCINQVLDHQSYTAIHIAALHNRLDITKFLLSVPSLDINKSANEWTALLIAIKAGFINIAKLILVHPNVDVNSCCWNVGTALHISSGSGNIEITEILLSHPAVDVNKLDRDQATPLLIACKKAKIKVVRLLMACPSIDVNKACVSGNSPLLEASEAFNREMIEILLSHPNIMINHTCKHMQNTPLHLIAERDMPEIAQMFLCRPDVEINRQNKNGFTPLHVATSKKCPKLVELFLSHPNIDVHLKERAGYTALHLAVITFNNCIKVVELLLSHPAIQVNARDTDGRSALFHAIDSDNLETVKLLLTHPDIDVNAEDDKRSDHIIKLAVESGNRDILEIILNSPCSSKLTLDCNDITIWCLFRSEQLEMFVDIILSDDRYRNSLFVLRRKIIRQYPSLGRTGSVHSQLQLTLYQMSRSIFPRLYRLLNHRLNSDITNLILQYFFDADGRETFFLSEKDLDQYLLNEFSADDQLEDRYDEEESDDYYS